MTTKEKAFKILNIISDKGYTSLIVGGAVRDMLMNIEPHDYDIATNMPMEEIEEIFNCHDIGKQKSFGLTVVVFEGDHFEVANFRTDGEYSDNRRPDSVKIVDTFHEDSKRRDFTINSMGMDKEGYILDFHKGQEDIKDGIIRTVGNPSERFREDYLRMLRAVRFATRLNFTFNIYTQGAIQTLSSNIDFIAKERIKEELFKMAEQSGDKFANTIEILDYAGLLKEILPEIYILQCFEHSYEHHPEGNVFEHTLSALRQNKEEGNPILNIAILLHDVGKAITYKWQKEKHTYYRHDYKGIEVIEHIANRLKFSTEEKDICIFVCKNHMKLHVITKMRNHKVANLITHKYFAILEKVSLCDDKSRLHEYNEENWTNYYEKVNHIRNKIEQTNDLTNIVTGKLILEITNHDPSSIIRDIKRKTIEKILDNKLLNEKDVKEYIDSMSKSKVKRVK